MSHLYILDEAGDPVPCDDVLTWGRWMETAERHVNLTEIEGVFVSTVFLGIDHDFSPAASPNGAAGGGYMSYGGKQPILFETMLWAKVPDDGTNHGVEWIDGCLRYGNRDHAQWGHEAVVRAVRNRLARPQGLGRLLEEGLQLTDAD